MFGTYNNAGYEFDAQDADVILVTGGGQPTEIRLHRCVLVAASPFFRDMFSLPQPVQQQQSHPFPTVHANFYSNYNSDSSMSMSMSKLNSQIESLNQSQPQSTSESIIPHIPIPETRNLMKTLLGYVYPIPRPVIKSLDELVPVLKAALKYDFVVAVEELKKILVSDGYLKECPLRVYGIACSFDLEEEAKIASKYTLGIDILSTPLCDEMKYITAYSYQRLINLHRTRSQQATELLKPPRTLKCPQCNSYGHSAYGNPKWWHEFVNKVKKELMIRPTTDGIFDWEFLKTTCVDGCPKCPLSLLEAGPILMDLKRQIDELPSTI